jgi:hypothetical protein
MAIFGPCEVAVGLLRTLRETAAGVRYPFVATRRTVPGLVDLGASTR